MDIHGHCDERFRSVLGAFENNFENNHEVGASFAATLEGEFVVDIWARHQDVERAGLGKKTPSSACIRLKSFTTGTWSAQI